MDPKDRNHNAPTLVESPSARSAAAAPRADRTSSQDGRYALGPEIARGGMGRVVEATDMRLGRVVALKEALTTDNEILRRFAREVRITARLEHPSIVPLHDAGVMPDGLPYYVMRKVSGRPLEQLVDQTKTLTERLALLPNLLAVTNAVAHAHSRGVLHRDLKPSNMLVGEHGETVVIDWGLAKIVGEVEDARDSLQQLGEETMHTQYGSVIGTPGFMSPEQLRGEPADARSDVYALGASLYFLLSLRLPHAAQTGDEMIQVALAGPPTPLTDVVEGVPAELATIVDKALGYNVDNRYRDAGGLAEDLDRFLKGQLVPSHRYSRWERLARFYRRHRIAVTVSLVAALTFAIGGTIAIRRIVAEKQRADVALADALDRNDALAFANARSLLATNPTAALAQIKPLVVKRWREARLLALAARATGVARGLPGARVTLSLELTRDGRRLLAAGDDGAVRIHDLATRSVRTVAELGMPMAATFVDDERAIVAWSGKRMVIIDSGRGTQRDIVLAAEPWHVRSDGARIWFAASDGRVFSLALDDAEPTQLAIAEPVHALEIGNRGIALAGDKHLWLVHDGTPRPILAGRAAALAWAETGALAAIIDDRVIQLDGERVTAQLQDRDAASIAWQAGTLYIGGQGTVRRFGEEPIRIGDGKVDQLVAGPGESLIARTNVNAITVVDRDVLVDLPPTSAIGVVTAARGSHFVLAGSDGIVLAWDLDHVLPRRIPLGGKALASARGRESVIVALSDQLAVWIDVRTAERTELALTGPFDSAVVSRDGKQVVIVDRAGRATRYARDGVPHELATSVARVEFAGPDRLVVVTAGSDVYLYDARGSQKLYSHRSPFWQLDARGDWAVVMFGDHSLWRYNVRTGASSLLPPAPERWMLILDDGAVAFTDRTTLHVWRRDGTFVDYVGIPPPAEWLFRAGPDHVVVFAGGDSGHVAELGGARRVALAYPPGSRMFDLNFARELGVYVDSGGRLHATQPVLGETWRVARPWRAPLRQPGITPDETRLFAVGDDNVLVWSQAVPPTMADTVVLVDELTNARTLGTGQDVQLTWR